jgi:hypothetical protein
MNSISLLLVIISLAAAGAQAQQDIPDCLKPQLNQVGSCYGPIASIYGEAGRTQAKDGGTAAYGTPMAFPVKDNNRDILVIVPLISPNKPLEYVVARYPIKMTLGVYWSSCCPQKPVLNTRIPASALKDSEAVKSVCQ